ncbi:Peroxisomal membrane protein PMP27 [Lachnellula suecica]|uniref:Peroxisomal membrane protein PMP27 n=1 Tax=Lachnellula suecica TaxID=602035 RepID=A0A8T9CDK8_9HELO|nr:Peroxisomal membrane protein PMP27 [Lachnellula suecica]
MPSLKHIIRFTTDAGALEKILRLLQSIAQILAAFAVTNEELKLWLGLRMQFSLGRRYFRFFKFLDCFSKGYEAFYNADGIGGILLVGKWTCLGGYMLLESSTILDVLGVWPAPWAQLCVIEGHRFWFYSLLFSIGWCMMQLFAADGNDTPVVEKSVGPSAEKRPTAVIRKKEQIIARRVLVRRLLTDVFDLFIPGHVTGWIVTALATVGLASIVSTLLASKEIWDSLKDK